MSVITVPWVHNQDDEYAMLDKDAERFYPVKTPDGEWSAVIREDGCIDLRRHYDAGDPDGDDYIHICDLDELLPRMHALKTIAQSHFGKDWK